MIAFLFTVLCATTVFTANAAPYNQADPNLAFKNDSYKSGDVTEAELSSRPPTPSPVSDGSHCEKAVATVAWGSKSKRKNLPGQTPTGHAPAEEGKIGQ